MTQRQTRCEDLLSRPERNRKTQRARRFRKRTQTARTRRALLRLKSLPLPQGLTPYNPPRRRKRRTEQILPRRCILGELLLRHPHCRRRILRHPLPVLLPTKDPHGRGCKVASGPPLKENQGNIWHHCRLLYSWCQNQPQLVRLHIRHNGRDDKDRKAERTRPLLARDVLEIAVNYCAKIDMKRVHGGRKKVNLTEILKSTPRQRERSSRICLEIERKCKKIILAHRLPHLLIRHRAELD